MRADRLLERIRVPLHLETKPADRVVIGPACLGALHVNGVRGEAEVQAADLRRERREIVVGLVAPLHVRASRASASAAWPSLSTVSPATSSSQTRWATAAATSGMTNTRMR